MLLTPGKRLTMLLAVTALAFGAAACGDDEEGGNGEAAQKEPSAEAGEVTFVATDYAFEAPSSLPAGENTIVLENRGKEEHELDMVLLKEDAPPVEELIKLPPGDAGKFFQEEVGHIPPIKAGDASKQNLVAGFNPGTYAFV